MGGWRCAKVPRGTVQLYGRIRTSTDKYGQLRTTDLLEYCDKPRQRAAPRCRALPLVGLDRKSISRTSGATSTLPLACWATAQRQAHIPTAVRRNPPLPHACPASAGRQAPKPTGIFQGRYRAADAGFASEKRGEWTCVLDPSGERRKAPQQQARTPRVQNYRNRRGGRSPTKSRSEATATDNQVRIASLANANEQSGDTKSKPPAELVVCTVPRRHFCWQPDPGSE